DSGQLDYSPEGHETHVDENVDEAEPAGPTERSDDTQVTGGDQNPLQPGVGYGEQHGPSAPNRFRAQKKGGDQFFRLRHAVLRQESEGSQDPFPKQLREST